MEEAEGKRGRIGGGREAEYPKIYDSAHLTGTRRNHTHAYVGGERRERERAHAPRTRDGVSGSRQRSPTTRRSFLGRHRSSLSRSATVVQVSAYVLWKRERERGIKRWRDEGRSSGEEEEESKGAREESRGRLVAEEVEVEREEGGRGIDSSETSRAPSPKYANFARNHKRSTELMGKAWKKIPSHAIQERERDYWFLESWLGVTDG